MLEACSMHSLTFNVSGFLTVGTNVLTGWHDPSRTSPALENL